MSTVAEIKEAIEKLPTREVTELAGWLNERDNEEWDRQIDTDAADGRLDFLFEEAGREAKTGKLSDWPSDRK